MSLAGQSTIGSADGTGSAARFRNPRAIAIDGAGNLFVADTSNHTIRKITPAAVVTTLAGLAGARGWDDGTGSAARFDSPQGVAVDSGGNVYVADTGSRSIRKITPAGVVTTLAGLGYVTGSKDGTGWDALFDQPQGIAVDGAGNVYVADTNNHAIRKISPGGATTTFAGSPTNRGNADGTGTAARFDSPQALAFDSAGNLFVADTNNYTIRKITPAAAVSTIAGLAGFAGDASGIGSAARFYQARGIAVASSGAIYVADSYNVKLGTPSNQPAITVQPQSHSVAAGSSVVLRVTATGGEPIIYQWQKDGVPLAGATNPALELNRIQASSTGSYTVSIGNAVGALTSATATLTVLSPLSNDNFAAAHAIAGSAGQASGHNNGATGEPGEPTHVSPFATASSIWFRWTATETGTAIFGLSTNFPVTAAVYRGPALANLTRLAQSSGTRLTFPATSGTTYHLAIGGSTAAARGNVSLNWRMILNDDFEFAQELLGNAGLLTGDNNGATGEPNEPVHSDGSAARNSSVWYRWTPAQSGTAVISAFPTSFPLVIAVYTGSSLSNLNAVIRGVSGSTIGAVFVANAGTTYHIAVGSQNYGSGSFPLSWRISEAPVIVSTSGGGSVAVGGSVSIHVDAVSFLPVTYTWWHAVTPRSSELVSRQTTPTLTLADIQPGDGGTYTVNVTNSAGSASALAGSISVLVPPPNDNFANAQTLTGLTGSVTGSNVNATGEPGEPAHWNAAGAASSVWYRWIPASSGLAVIDTVGSAFDTVLAVYTGNALASLTRLVHDDDRGGGRTSQVSFAATAGTTYHIAVGGSTGSARGNLTLGWQLSPILAVATPPASQTIAIGGSATFSVEATGTGVTYQWHRNGVPISGATAPTLTVANAQAGSDASYTVTIASSGGSVTSAPATLAVAAPALTNLTTRNTRAGGSLLWGLAAHGSTMVAVGNGGAILSSSDNGRTWTPRISGTTSWIVGVTHGDGQFVAVADQGLILTSPDGITWTPAMSSGTTQRLNNVLHADGKFVAVGEAGTIVTSTDARVWTPRSSGTTNWLHGLAYNARIGHFAASGQAGVFLYSADGVTWHRLAIAGLTADLEATVAVDSYAQFVAIGQDGVVAAIHQNQLILKTGETLITWSGEYSSTGSAVRLRGLTQGASALFATGENGRVITATDHRGPWYTLPSGTTANLLAGMYHNNTLYIVGENEIALQSDPLFSSRLVNISTRGHVGTGANLMISGFVVTGDRPKQVLVRAAGPTLATSFGVTGTLEAPVLTLADSESRTIATNTGWSTNANAATIASTAARVGAFPFPASSADSALLTTLTPGNYTALISGANNTTGVSIVEVYDVDAISNEGSRAINISTRGVAGTGASKIIAGFVIDGASSRRVLIRAVGPTLGAAPFNIGGTLAEPQIELYNSRNLLHATVGAWGLQSNADEIRGSAKAVGAFDLPDGSRDSAMVVTLLPGAWTVQVGGPGTTSGVVLVEVYALP